MIVVAILAAEPDAAIPPGSISSTACPTQPRNRSTRYSCSRVMTFAALISGPLWPESNVQYAFLALISDSGVIARM